MGFKNDYDENSRFQEAYHKNINSNKSTVPFNLEAIEVAKVVEKIILSKNAKIVLLFGVYLFYPARAVWYGEVKQESTHL